MHHHGIRVHIVENPEEVAERAAIMIASQIDRHPKSVLGFATGSTPEKTYAHLVRIHQRENLSFAGIRGFNLDEYWGLPANHPQSYRQFMQHHLFRHVDIQPWNTHVLDGTAVYPDLECSTFETHIRAVGGVDLWLLGIGANGHIAFNEPGSSVDSRTRLVTLTPSTIAANSDGRFFKDPAEVPRCALTAGIGTIREARRLLLLATGTKKAAAIAAAVQGEFSSDCPASLLQDHPECDFIVDREAASKLVR